MKSCRTPLEHINGIENTELLTLVKTIDAALYAVKQGNRKSVRSEA
jgi:hypothetical protein